MGLNLSNLETVIQAKVDGLTSSSTDKDVLLTSKSIEAATADITITNVIAEGVTATTKAGEASASATSAASSASTATTKASEASASAATATTKASEASASATSATGSASTATTKASEASASASIATTKASEAATSASNAASAVTTALASKADTTYVDSEIASINVNNITGNLNVTGSVTCDGATVELGYALKLQNAAGSATTAEIACAGAGTNTDIAFRTAATERMRIDSAGRVTMPYQPIISLDGAASTTTVSAGYIISSLTPVVNQGGMGWSSGRVTVPVAGVYQIHLNVYHYNVNGCRTIIKINGAETSLSNSANSTTADESRAQTIIRTVGPSDYIEFGVSSGNRIYLGSRHTFASVQKIA